MEKDLKKLYQYARQRIRQKKKLYLHFILFLCACLLMFASAVLIRTEFPSHWYFWTGAIWFFILILHFIKVYIKDRFMNKHWEREQIERLIARQKNRINQLESKISTDPEQNKS